MNEKGKQKVVKMSNFNCPNCGAPISGDRCDYCGTQFIDCTTLRPDKAFYLKYSPDGKKTIVAKVILESARHEIEHNEFITGRDINGRLMSVYSSPEHIINVTYRVVN